MSLRFTNAKVGLAALAAGFAVALASAPASAVIIDPQLFVQQSGNSPAGGTAIGGETNLITNAGGFVIGVAGNHTMNNPLLVVVAVPNGNGTPSISFSGCANPMACPLATVGTYGLTANTGTLTSGTAFAALGLNAGGSESIGNFQSADSLNGFGTPTSYSLHAFALPVSLNPANNPITVDESGAANGSLILAYSCEGTPGISACSGGAIGQTVNTNTGLLDATPTPPPVPEPSSLASLGFGLAALGLFLGWRRRRI